MKNYSTHKVHWELTSGLLEDESTEFLDCVGARQADLPGCGTRRRTGARLIRAVCQRAPS